MRAHLDQVVIDSREPRSLVRFWAGQAVLEAERLGARRVAGVVVDEQGSFQVVQDPEGNEFCFVHD